MAGKRLRAGKLRNLIAVHSNADTRDTYGGVVSGWSELTTLYAKIEAGGGSESVSGDQVSASAAFKFVCRFNPDVVTITPQMRVIYDSRTFDIVAVENVAELDVGLTISCVELSL